MVVYGCNRSTWWVEVGEFEFSASLRYLGDLHFLEMTTESHRMATGNGAKLAGIPCQSLWSSQSVEELPLVMVIEE